MSYIGVQPNNIKKNIGLYTPNEILQLEKDGHWGGSLELIAEQTANGTSATVEFLDNMQENIYDVHLLQISGWQSSDNNRTFILKFYESGVLENASVYQYARQFGDTSGSFSEVASTSNNYLTISNYKGSTRTGNGYIYLYNLGNSSKYSFCSFQTLGGHSTDQMVFGGAVLPQASTVDGIRVLGGTGTTDMTDFTLKLFGIKEL